MATELPDNGHASSDLRALQFVAGNRATALSPQGWRARLDLRFARRRERTRLIERHHHGPLLVQRPFYPEAGGVCHTYLLHPPAGIVGGDDLAIDVAVDDGAHALITTPAATRWYRSSARRARLQQRARVADAAVLEWLPQETLLFDGAHAHLSTRIDLTGDARFFGWEVLGFGRPACGETFRNGELDFRLDLYRDTEPIVLERLRAGGTSVPGVRSHAACATLLATSAGEDSLAIARTLVVESDDAVCGASLIGDVLICRGLAPHCAPLIELWKRLWTALRPGILSRAASPPRVWRT